MSETDAPGAGCFLLPVVLEEPAEWTLCVDIGTSSTAIWCGLIASSELQLPLPLGKWLETIDRTHAESSAVNGGGDGVLLPSNIGLSSSMNFRDRFDVLSLGDPSNSGDSEESVRNRLIALGRRYDISIPFPSTSDMGAYAAQIVFAPKRDLISDTNPALQPNAVLHLANGRAEPAGVIDRFELFTDYFDEISSYVLPRVLDWAAQRDPRGEYRAVLDKWLAGDERLQLIVTHPSGLSDEKRGIYTDASKRFAERIHSGFKWTNAAPAQVSGIQTVLVSESLAAARFGIEMLLARREEFEGPQPLVILDIGAGTFDVIVLTARIAGRSLDGWDVHSHFGLSIGGMELDKALLTRVVDILGQAERVVSKLARDLPTSMEDLVRADTDADRLIGVRLMQEFRAAKARLTKSLMEMVESGRLDRYCWEGRHAPAFSIKVGEIIGGRAEPHWPVQVTNASPDHIDFDHPHAALRLRSAERPRGGDGPERREVWLDLRPEALQPEDGYGDALARILRLLATEIPSVAGAAGRHYAKADTPARWIVTGRTALWAPLYDGIARVARDVFGGVMEAAPFSPRDMKVAVVHGARRIASEPHLDIGDRIFNPVALARVNMKMKTRDDGASFQNVPAVSEIAYLSDSKELAGPGGARGASSMQLVCAIPCLDERLPGDDRRLFERLEAIPEMPPYWSPIRQLDQIAPDRAVSIEPMEGRAGKPQFLLRIGADVCILSLDGGTSYGAR